MGHRKCFECGRFMALEQTEVLLPFGTMFGWYCKDQSCMGNEYYILAPEENWKCWFVPQRDINRLRKECPEWADAIEQEQNDYNTRYQRLYPVETVKLITGGLKYIGFTGQRW